MRKRLLLATRERRRFFCGALQPIQVSGEQGDPLARELGDVAELLADEGGALEVVLGDQQLVEAVALLREEEAYFRP